MIAVVREIAYSLQCGGRRWVVRRHPLLDFGRWISPRYNASRCVNFCRSVFTGFAGDFAFPKKYLGAEACFNMGESSSLGLLYSPWGPLASAAYPYHLKIYGSLAVFSCDGVSY